MNLLNGLRRRRIGTHTLEKAAKLVTEEDERDEKVVIKVLDIAVSKAEMKASRAKKEAHRSCWKANRVLPAGWRRRRFSEILSKEVGPLWVDGGKRNRVKVDRLEAKYRPRKEESEVRGIPISDEKLGEDEEEAEVLAYGVELSEDEQAFLKLPKSATDYSKVDDEKCKTSIQVTAAKLRMSIKNLEENGTQGMEGSGC